MSKVSNILLAGVGGQGILLASEVLSEVMLLAGLDVKKMKSMACPNVEEVLFPTFAMETRSTLQLSGGEVDILFSFEMLETCRYLPLVRKNGQIIINNWKIAPPSVALGKQVYPENLVENVRTQFPKTKVVDGLDLALEAGNSKTVNIVLLGALSNMLDFDKQLWLTALKKMIPAKLLDINLKAFELGCQVK